MWGIFGKPLNRAIWNTLGLHAVLTTCLIFSSVLGMYAPMESQPLWKGATMRMNPIRNNESSLEHCLCPVRCPVYSSGLKIVTTYPPPPTHTFLKRPFRTDFKKHAHTPPRGNDILVH